MVSLAPAKQNLFDLMANLLLSASLNNTRQFTFSFEGRTYEHQGRIDFWFWGASVAAGLRHAVVSTQHQQVGQGSLCLLREANTEVNGLPLYVLIWEGKPQSSETWIIQTWHQMEKKKKIQFVKQSNSMKWQQLG